MDQSRPPVDSLLETIRSLERRVSRIEQGSPLVGNLPAGESISVVDPNDGSPLVTLGEASNGRLGAEFRNAAGDRLVHIGELPGGATGLEAGSPLDAGASFLLVSEEGIRLPYLSHGWTIRDDYRVITSGSYVTTHEAVVGIVTHGTVGADYLVVSCDSGTVGKARVRCSVGGTTSEVTCPSGVSSNLRLRWDNSANLVLQSGPVSFFYEVLRVSGAGNVNVYNPGNLYMGDVTTVAGGLSITV